MTGESGRADRREFITSGRCPPAPGLAAGVDLRVFVSGQLGAAGLCTGTATLGPGAELPYHTHAFSEAITVLEGGATAEVEGRRYRLTPHDAMHIPTGVAHLVRNDARDAAAVLHWVFASDSPTRELVAADYTVRDCCEPDPGCPEHLTRFERAPVYELSPRARFRDLFSGRTGSRGICGGYGRFEPGSSLPCHVHEYDESITIVEGTAVCQCAGREYELSSCDTASIPRGRPHRFINRSDREMAMIWVYAGDRPEREILDQARCESEG